MTCGRPRDQRMGLDNERNGHIDSRLSTICVNEYKSKNDIQTAEMLTVKSTAVHACCTLVRGRGSYRVKPSSRERAIVAKFDI